MMHSMLVVLAQTDAPAPSDATPPQVVLPDGDGGDGGGTVTGAAAEGTTSTGADGSTGAKVDASTSGDALPPPRPDLDPFTVIMLLGVVLLFVFMFSGQRKEKKRRQAMLAAMAKGDRVQTVGGVLGTIMEIKDDEITLKVDENSNTRMRFARNSIASVIKDKPE